MILKLKTAPADEPVTIDEAKAHCYLDDVDVRGVMDDVKLASLIKMARQYLENFCGPFLTQTWEQYEDTWPSGERLIIGKPRAIAVESVIYTDEDETAATFAATNYSVDIVNEFRPAVVLKPDYSWPDVSLFNANPIKITFTCGYGNTADDVPESIRHAIMLLVAHWYEERQPVLTSMGGGTVLSVPLTVDALMANYRVWQ